MTLFTLTGNLLAERTLTFDSWTPGRTQRARTSSFQVGGKGINVSRMLQRLGTPARALCFTGGDAGEACLTWFRDHRLPVQAFATAVETRSGVVVRSGNQAETTFLGPDAPADAEALASCARFLESLPEDSALALCGSFPGWDSPGAAPFRAALTQWIASRSLFVDTYGPPLAWCITQPVALVKINRDEFDLLFDEGERSRPVKERMSEVLAKWPVRAWIITDGPKQVCVAARDLPPVVLTPPEVEEVSPTGSGDVFFACVLHGLLHRKLNLAQSAAFALPYAAANAAHPGIAEFDLNHLPSPRSKPI